MKNKDLLLAWIQGACEYVRYDVEEKAILYHLVDRSAIPFYPDTPIEVNIILYRYRIECEAYVPYEHPDKSLHRRSEYWTVTCDDIKECGLNGFLEMLSSHARMEYLA